MKLGSLVSLTSLVGIIAGAALAGCAPAHDEDVASSEHADTASAQTIAACPSDGSNATCPIGSFAVTCANGTHEVATVAQIKSDQICNAGSRGTLTCQLVYVTATGNTAQMGSFAVAVDQTYPELAGRTLGDASLPFSAVVTASPELLSDGSKLPSDGYVDLGITDNTTHTPTSTGEAQVSLARLGQGSPQVVAGYLDTWVTPFVYQDVTYQTVLTYCTVTPTP